jgi:phage/plasmid-like protein (TIGR03299 family)
MSHNIFNERFISLRRPAWHGLGIVHEDEIGARESLTRIGGQPVITLEPLYTEVGETKVLLPNRSILRHPTADDPEFVHLGVVGPRYELLTLEDVANIWDAVVGRPIETMGILQRGANAFLTSKLPAIDVKGDEIERYIGVTTPLDGMRVATAEEWDVRVVCQNTLNAAQAQALSTCRVVHDKEARGRIARWLKDAYERAESNIAVVKEAFELLASTPVGGAQVNDVLDTVYPEIGVRLDTTLAQHVIDRRVHLAEAHNRRQQKYRNAALELFEGKGIGMETPAAKGTAWGCYQAVCECADYRRGTNRGGKPEVVQVAEAAMFGNRAAEKQRAFDACLALAQGDSEPTPATVSHVPNLLNLGYSLN